MLPRLLPSYRVALVVGCVAFSASACGSPNQTRPATDAQVANASVAPSSTAAPLDAKGFQPVLPTGTGLFIDPSLTREEFDEILKKDGYTADQMIKDDATIIDVRVDEPFASQDEIVGKPSSVPLIGGYVVVDGVVVIEYADGTNACHAPVGGSTAVRDGVVYVSMFSGFKHGVDECSASTERWRATLVVPEAKYGMEVRQEGTDAPLGGVSAPLIENLPASLIFPDEFPAMK